MGENPQKSLTLNTNIIVTLSQAMSDSSSEASGRADSMDVPIVNAPIENPSERESIRSQSADILKPTDIPAKSTRTGAPLSESKRRSLGVPIARSSLHQELKLDTGKKATSIQFNDEVNTIEPAPRLSVPESNSFQALRPHSPTLMVPYAGLTLSVPQSPTLLAPASMSASLLVSARAPVTHPGLPQVAPVALHTAESIASSTGTKENSALGRKKSISRERRRTSLANSLNVDPHSKTAESLLVPTKALEMLESQESVEPKPETAVPGQEEQARIPSVPSLHSTPEATKNATSSDPRMSAMGEIMENWEDLMENPTVRKVRIWLASIKLEVHGKLFIFLIQIIPFLLFIHIIFNWVGHVPQILAHDIIHSIHRLLVSSHLSHNGISINGLHGGPMSKHSEGYMIRIILMFLASSITVIMALIAYNFQWVPVSTLLKSDSCVPAVYSPDFTTSITNFDDFLQAANRIVPMYTYGIPLEDGIVGAWSALPLSSPGSEFSIRGSAYGYALGVDCFYPKALDTPVTDTSFDILHLDTFKNVIEGAVRVRMPPNTLIVSDGATSSTGFEQECHFTIRWGAAFSETQFVSDPWGNVSPNQINSVSFGKSSITHGNSKGKYYPIVLMLAKNYQRMLISLWNGTTFQKFHDQPSIDLLAWTADNAGYYRSENMWRGVSVVLASSAHFLLMQYNPNAVGVCDYFANHGAGYMHVSGPWMTVLQFVCYVLTGGLLLHLWWVFMAFEIDEACELAAHTLRSPLRFVHDFHIHCKDIFGDTTSSNDTLNEDMLKAVGDTQVLYGVDENSTQAGIPRLAFGPKYSILPIKKFLNHQKLKKKEESARQLSEIKGSKNNLKASKNSLGGSAQLHTDDSSMTSITGLAYLVQTMNERWETFWEDPKTRSLRETWSMPQTGIIVKVVALIILVLIIILMVILFPVFHITFNLIGQFVFFICLSLLSSAHKLIISAKLGHHGTTLRSLMCSPYSRAGPGYMIRIFLIVLAFIIPVTMSVGAYYFEWVHVESELRDAHCIPARYNKPPILWPDVKYYLQGQLNLATLSTFSIPIADGVIGGWGAWPTESLSKEFDISSAGIGYGITVQCFTPLTTPNVGSKAILTLPDFDITENVAQGLLNLYMPPNSVVINGNVSSSAYTQQCLFSCSFGKATVRTTFQSDEWDTVTVKKIHSVAVGDKVFAHTDTNRNWYSMFAMRLEADQWDFAKRFGTILTHTIDGSACDLGLLGCKLLFRSGYSDEQYHPDANWKSISITLASVAHMAADQFDTTNNGTCPAFGENGAGILLSSGPWLTILQVECYLLLAGLALHLWWIYLRFQVDYTCGIVSHAIHAPVRFAFDIQTHAQEIFGSSASAMTTLNADIEKIHGEKILCYGVLLHTIDQSIPQVGFGLRKRVIPIVKIEGNRSQQQDKSKLGTEVPRNIRWLLKKKFNKRTPRDIKTLYTYVKNIKAFKQLTEQVLKQVCGVLKLMSYNANQTVFQQGDIGTEWFIILVGSVNVLITKTGDPKDRIVVANLPMGTGFEPCELLIVEKTYYNKILKSVHQSDLTEKRQFLKKLPFMEDLDDAAITDFIAHMTWVRFEQDQKVVDEEAKFLYLIRKGQATVTRDIIGPAGERLTVVIKTLTEGMYFGVHNSCEYDNTVIAGKGGLRLCSIPTAEAKILFAQQLHRIPVTTYTPDQLQALVRRKRWHLSGLMTAFSSFSSRSSRAQLQ
ncbi:hypothetical protein EDD86DRAFT_256399 [Gorgonomyces haynaldii]|nr:hypothetical protein EDD86DRAFT_256399 [Gorgonomyces haynaldii]